MRLEVGLSPFDAAPVALAAAATAADEAGITGIWTMDHLSGFVHHGRRTVLEGLTCLAILASATTRCRIGPLVVNAALRPPAVLAQALATVQAWSGGRLVVGLGAGGGGGRYGDELRVAGLTDDPPPVRRARVEDTIEILGRAWSGSTEAWRGRLAALGPGGGLLRPEPVPALVVGGYGPRMAELAGRRARGFNTSADHADLEALGATARRARTGAGGGPFEFSAFALYEPGWLDPTSDARRRLVDAGVDVLVLWVHAPHDHDVLARIAAASGP
ncbi:MAG: LLM class flavin-dependent oxidoreductase [Acidimicrobiales bacterium]